MVMSRDNCDKMRELLNCMFEDDERTRKIVEQAGLTQAQIQVVSLLIVQAIRYYDTLNSGGEFAVGDSDQ